VSKQAEPRRNVGQGLWFWGSVITLDREAASGEGVLQESLFHCAC